MAAALEQVASVAATIDDNDALLARALYVRFATEQAIERVGMSAAAVLGGMSFIESPEIAYLLGATRALAFHPPSRAEGRGPDCPLPRRQPPGLLTLGLRDRGNPGPLALRALWRNGTAHRDVLPGFRPGFGAQHASGR